MSLQSLIDNPTELLELINDCLKPKDVEKKQFGEVFTPMKLVNEMLDKLKETNITQVDITIPQFHWKRDKPDSRDHIFSAQGIQLLPSIDVPKFKQEYHEHEIAFHTLVDSLVMDYDSIVSDMAFKQGTMFNRADYPTAQQVKHKFSLNLYVSEVPMNDFRCGIAQDIADDLKAHYERQAQGIIENVANESLARLAEVMQSISHCCGVDESEVNGEVRTKRRKIYDTTIQKALEMCESFKGFNLKHDSELELARASLEKVLHGVTAEDIRDSDAVRSNVKEGIDDILSKFSGFSCV